METQQVGKKAYYMFGLLLIPYLVFGYFLATFSEQAGFAFYITFIGYGSVGAFFAFASLVSKKYLVIWAGLFCAVIGCAAGVLAGHSDKAIYWGILSLVIGHVIGFELLDGVWKGMLIGAMVGVLIVILSGPHTDFDGVVFANQTIMILYSFFSAMLMGAFWGGGLQMVFDKKKG